MKKEKVKTLDMWEKERRDFSSKVTVGSAIIVGGLIVVFSELVPELKCIIPALALGEIFILNRLEYVRQKQRQEYLLLKQREKLSQGNSEYKGSTHA